MDISNQKEKERETKGGNKEVVKIIAAVIIALIVYSIFNAAIEVHLNRRLIEAENKRYEITTYQKELLCEAQKLSEYKGRVEEINNLYLSSTINQKDAIIKLQEIMDEIDKICPGFKDDVLDEIAHDEHCDLSENVYTLETTIRAQLDFYIEVIMSQIV